MREADFPGVVITGMGAVTPIGLDVPTFSQSLKEGKCGIGYLEPEEDFKDIVKIGAQIKGFDGTKYFEKKMLRRIHPVVQHARAALEEALLDGNICSPDFLLKEGIDPEVIGSFISSGIGGGSHVAKMEKTISKKGADRLSPFDLLNIISCRVNLVQTMAFPIWGPALTPVNACNSPGASLYVAINAIKSGDVQIAIAGGSEAVVDQIGIGAFSVMRALSTNEQNPQEACKPFDINADGFVLGEAAGILILENERHADERGAKKYAKLLGYRVCSDSTRVDEPADLVSIGLPSNFIRNPDTDPSITGATKTMSDAIKRSGLSPEEIDFVSGHGPGTIMGGLVESLAIKKVFKKHKVPINSVKAHIGHTVAGAIVEIIGAIMAAREGILPATKNLRKPVRNDLDYIMLESRRQSVRIFLKNYFGFGGSNGSFVFEVYPD